MKRLSATIATLILGLLITSTVIGFTVQTPSTFTKTSQNETFTKQIGGTVFAVAKQGNYAYVGIGKSLTVLDVQDPTNPQQVGQTEQLDNIVYSLTISGTTAFAPQEKGLRIFDISDPTEPQLVETYDLPSTYVGDVVISGTIAFVPEKPTHSDPPTTGGLRILDVSDPLNIGQVAIFGEGDGVEAVALDGNYAYLAYDEHSSPSEIVGEKTVILDISSIDSPIELNRINSGTEDIAIYGNHLYIIANGLYVYEISNPIAPTRVKTIEGTYSFFYNEVFIYGDKLYVGLSAGGFEVFDLSDPANPSNQQSYGFGSFLPVHDIVADGNTAYLAYHSAGLQIVDIQATITEIGNFNSFGWPFEALKYGGYVYLLDSYKGLEILNVKDPINPTKIGGYPTSSSFHSMQLAHDTLILNSRYKLEILDATDPRNPTFLSNYTPNERIEEAITHGNYVYIGRDDSGESSLEIIDISDKTNPTQIATVGTSGRTYSDGMIVGAYLFLVEKPSWSLGDSRFHVIDISNPSNPQIKKSLPFPGYLRNMAIIGNYAYIGHRENGILIINISNALNPIVEEVFPSPNSADSDYWVTAVNGQLYAATINADESYLPDIFDVSNPTAPVKVGEYDHFDALTTSFIKGVEVNGYNYYPSQREGLLIYECHDCIVLDKNVYLPLIIKN